MQSHREILILSRYFSIYLMFLFSIDKFKNLTTVSFINFNPITLSTLRKFNTFYWFSNNIKFFVSGSRLTSSSSISFLINFESFLLFNKLLPDIEFSKKLVGSVLLLFYLLSWENYISFTFYFYLTFTVKIYPSKIDNTLAKRSNSFTFA